MLKKLLVLFTLLAQVGAEAAPLTNGWIRNSDISPSAAIAYSKLNLAGSILNADINSSAAIAYSKLNLASSLLNGDIAANAAIAVSKLASQNAYTILGNNTGSSSTPVAFTVTNFADMLRARVTAGASIAASDIDWSAADYFVKNLTASTTFTFSNQRAFQCVQIDVTNTASNFTVSWPANVRWAADTTPTVTLGVKSDAFNCCYNGTITKCAVQQNFRPN